MFAAWKTIRKCGFKQIPAHEASGVTVLAALMEVTSMIATEALNAAEEARPSGDVIWDA